MKNYLLVFFFLLSLNLFIQAEENTKPVILDDKYFDIFLNKKQSSLKGVKEFLSIKDGVVHAYPAPDKKDRPNFILVSKKSYEKYTLSFDFKWGEFNNFLPPEKITAGIYMHAFEKSLNLDKTFWPKSVECKLLQGKEGMAWIVEVESKTFVPGAKKYQGRKGNHITGRVDIPEGVKDFKKWHKVEIQVNKDQCSFIVNGKTTIVLKSIRTFDGKAIESGKYAFGFEGAEILLKNIQLSIDSL